MATSSKKNEIIYANINGEEIQLTGEDLQIFLDQRAIDQAASEIRKAETEARKAIRISALKKLGLTEEEINAIL